MTSYELLSAVGTRFHQISRVEGSLLGHYILEPCAPGVAINRLLRDCSRAIADPPMPALMARKLNTALSSEYPGNAGVFFAGVRLTERSVDVCTAGLFRVYRRDSEGIATTRIHTRAFDHADVVDSMPIDDPELAQLHGSMVTRSLGGPGPAHLDTYSWSPKDLEWVAIASARWFEGVSDEDSARRIQRFVDRGEVSRGLEEEAIVVLSPRAARGRSKQAESVRG